MNHRTGWKLACSVAALGLLAACQPKAATGGAGAVDTTKAAEEIKALTASTIAAFNAHDAEKTTAIDMDDYVGMMHGAPNVIGKAADLAVTKQQVADPAAKVEISDNTVDVAKAGDMAVQRMTYAYTYTDPKTKAVTTEHGNWLLGWKPQAGGGWKLAWGVISDTPAPK